MKELFHRTSIRKFTAEPVAREDLLTILRAGMQGAIGDEPANRGNFTSSPIARR